MTETSRPQPCAPTLGAEQRAAYRIEVQGTIGASWAAWFEGTSIEQRADMVIIDTIVDQAALARFALPVVGSEPNRAGREPH